MAYGFNESKSKVEVVDKATQDAKDASQDTSITGLGNRLTVVEETIENMGSAVEIVNIESTVFSTTVSLPAGSKTSEQSYSFTGADRYVSNNTNSKQLKYDFASGKFMQVNKNMTFSSVVNASTEDDYDSSYGTDNKWCYITLTNFPISSINTWLQTLVGQQLIDGSGMAYITVSTLHIVINSELYFTGYNQSNAKLYGLLEASVSVDSNGVITSIGSVSGTIKSNQRGLSSGNTVAYPKQDLSIKAVLGSYTSSEPSGTVMVSG